MRICRDVFQKARPAETSSQTLSPCKSPRADARTRTGDPFITSDGAMSAPVRSSHSRPPSVRLPPDWSGLEVTCEDNLVDGWWTSAVLTV
jgi:hypothetical protein